MRGFAVLPSLLGLAYPFSPEVSYQIHCNQYYNAKHMNFFRRDFFNVCCLSRYLWKRI
jgi:hypothetical protein